MAKRNVAKLRAPAREDKELIRLKQQASGEMFREQLVRQLDKDGAASVVKVIEGKSNRRQSGSPRTRASTSQHPVVKIDDLSNDALIRSSSPSGLSDVWILGDMSGPPTCLRRLVSPWLIEAREELIQEFEACGQVESASALRRAKVEVRAHALDVASALLGSVSLRPMALSALGAIATGHVPADYITPELSVALTPILDPRDPGGVTKPGWDKTSFLAAWPAELNSMHTAVVPAVAEIQIARLEQIIRDAQDFPPEDKASFVRKVNEILVSASLAFFIDGKPARFRISRSGSIQFKVSGNLTPGFYDTKFDIKPYKR